jgi:hypothetical protein
MRPAAALLPALVAMTAACRAGGGSTLNALPPVSEQEADSSVAPADTGPSHDSAPANEDLEASLEASDAADGPADKAEGGPGPDSAFVDADLDAGTPGEGTGVFVAVGYGGRRMRSTDDGQTWTDDQSLEPNGGDDMELLRTVTFGAGQFIAAGWQTYSSPDGKTWSALPATHQNWFGALVYSDPLWVAVGGYGMRLTSSDAMTWVDHSIDTIAAHPHGCLTLAEAPSRRFVACNDNGARSYSNDGSAWTYSSGAVDVTSSQVVSGAGVVVGVDGVNVVLSHDGGQTWAKETALDVMGGGLVFAQGHFTYLSTDVVYTSTDGATWAKHMATGARPSALAYGHSTYVAVRGHQWQRSTDGITWGTSVEDASQTNAFEWVTFGATGP